MSADLSTLFNDFDRGKLSRRQLLQALGIAVAMRPAAAFAQGQCGGARAGTPGCEPTPAKLPFEPTGWNTVLLDHFSCRCADYPKEAAYYAGAHELEDPQRRRQAGGAGHRRLGRSRAPRRLSGAARRRPPATPPRGRGAAGGRWRRGGGAPRAPRNAAFDGFCWGIEPWDAKKVEAELRKRGLTPVADNHGKDFQSFHVKDPDGFDLRISNGNREEPPPGRRQAARRRRRRRSSRRTGKRSGSITSRSRCRTTRRPSRSTMRCSAGSRARTKAARTSARSATLATSSSAAAAAATAAPRGSATPPARRAAIGHISFGITPFDPDEVKAELDKRGLTARVDTGGRGDIHTAPYKSYHTTTPNGFDLQISATTRATRDG